MSCIVKKVMDFVSFHCIKVSTVSIKITIFCLINAPFYVSILPRLCRNFLSIFNIVCHCLFKYFFWPNISFSTSGTPIKIMLEVLNNLFILPLLSSLCLFFFCLFKVIPVLFSFRIYIQFILNKIYFVTFMWLLVLCQRRESTLSIFKGNRLITQY